MRESHITSLLSTVFGSILQVFIICFAGWFLARCSILDKRTQKQLNRINVSLFTPCLLFSKVAFFLTPQKLKELWIIPVFFALVTVASMIVAKILGTVFRLQRTQRNFAIAASMFMNSNSLPIALMQSLVVTVPHLQWGEDDNEEAMVGRALTYLVLYSTLGMILRWSYGVHLLQQSDELTADSDGRQRDSESNNFAGPRPALDVALMNPPPKKVVKKLKSGGFRTNTDNSPNTSPTLTSGSASSSRENLVLGRTDGEPLPTSDSGVSRVSTASTLVPPSNSNSNSNAGGRGRDSQIFYSFPNTPVRSRTDLSRGVRARMVREPSEESEGSDSEDEGCDVHVRTRARAQGGEGEEGEREPEGEEGGENTPLLINTSPHRPRRRHHSHHPRQFPSPFLSSTHLSSLLTSTTHRITSFFATLNKFMTVPLYTSLFSLVVALIPPLQHVLSEHAGPLKGAVASVGSCSIPVTLVVLGGYFWVPREERVVEGGEGGETAVPAIRTANGVVNANGNGNGTNPSIPSRPRTTTRRKSLLSARQDPSLPGETRTVWVSIISRMILVPLLIFPVLFYGSIIEWEESEGVNVLEDPVFILSLVLLVSSPPALTLAQITQKASGDAFERLISRTIFWAYCIATPPLTIVYVVLGLWLANL